MRFLMLAGVCWMAAGAGFAQAQDPNPMFPGQQPTRLQEVKIGNKTYVDWLRELNAVDPAAKEAAMQALMIYGSQKEYAKEVRKDVGPPIIRLLNEPSTTDVSLKVNGALVLG